MKNKIIISVVIIAQVVLIIFLGLRIYQKKSHVLGEMSVIPIQKENVVNIPTNELKYYYEPAANSTQKDDPRIPIASEYTINYDSLNERYDYETDKSDDVFRIVALGDSFTFGYYVPTKHNWSEKLEDLLINHSCERYKKFEVVNLGVHGYDVRYALERFKLRGIKYNPDLVVWFLKDDDFVFINELFNQDALAYEAEMKVSGEYNELIKQGQYSPGWVKAQDMSERKYGRENLIAKSNEYLQKMKTLYQKDLVFMTLPSSESTIKNLLVANANENANSYFYELDTNIFKDSTLYYKGDWHPTVKGHGVIADDLYSYLIKNALIPCN